MRRRKLKLSAALSVALIATGVMASESQALTIRIFGTSDLFDSNVFQSEMETMYNATSPFFVTGDTLSYTSVGSGKALTSAEQGFADVVLVHSPPLEHNFVTGGYSYEPLGRSLLFNDYVIVGPTSDPADVTQLAPNDGVKAYQVIAQQGAAHGNATFVSRNDASGTNVQEETMWGQVDGSVPTQTAQNGGGVAGLKQPAASSGSTLYPSWYVRQLSTLEQGQGANLISTSTCAAAFAPDRGCYTMTDRGTLLYLHSIGEATGLTIVSQNNSAGATGGVTELTNPFHAYIVNPVDPKTGGAYPGPQPQPNVTAATRFVNFLTGATGNSGTTGNLTYPPVFQTGITSYLQSQNGGVQVFHPDAFPYVNSAAPAVGSHSVPAGSPQTLSGNLYYAPFSPTGASPITSIPYKFNISVDGGAWTQVGAGGVSTAGGHVTATATMPTGTHTVRVQLSTPVYNDLVDPFATQFSPHEDTVDFGTFST